MTAPHAVEAAQELERTARTRRQSAGVALGRAVWARRRLVGTRWLLGVAAVLSVLTSTAGGPFLFWLPVAGLCLAALGYSVRTLGPQYRDTVTQRELDLQEAQRQYDEVHQRMLDTEARHEETP